LLWDHLLTAAANCAARLQTAALQAQLHSGRGNGGEGGGGHFTQVVQALASALHGHSFAMPPHLARVVRALAVLEGGATALDPAFEVVPRVSARALSANSYRGAPTVVVVVVLCSA
jgi:hypothetical protein